MIDLSHESTLTLEEAAARHRVHFSTLFRWVLRGCRNPSGELVKLEALRLGGRWLTSEEALQRYADRLTPAMDAEPAPAPRSAGARARANEKAKRQLQEIGI